MVKAIQSVAKSTKVKEIVKEKKARAERVPFRKATDPVLTEAPQFVDVNADGTLAEPGPGEFSPAVHKNLKATDFGDDKALLLEFKANGMDFRAARIVSAAGRLRSKAQDIRVNGDSETKSVSGKLTRVLAQASMMEEILRAELGDEYDSYMAKVRDKAKVKAAELARKQAEKAASKK